MRKAIVLITLMAVLSYAQNPMMVNLAEARDYSTESIFKDEFKLSRNWISQHEDSSWGKGSALEVDSNGWITSLQNKQYAETLLFAGGNRNYNETFKLLYDGEGRFDFAGASIDSNSPGRMTITVTGSDALFLRIRETNPSNYIKNIRLLREEDEDTYLEQPFQEQFIQRWSGFYGIRFMDWGQTNEAVCSTWAQRTTPHVNTQTKDEGVALEYMIKLANITETKPWICIPHKADDNFIRKTAEMIRDSLNPDLKVYIEWSNEVWNSGFKVAAYAEAKGVEEGLSTDPFQARLFYQAKRSLEMFNIFEEVFGGSTRLIKVMGSFGAVAWVGEQVLGYGEAWKKCDVLAVAPYFGGFLGDPETMDEVQNWSLDQIFDTLDSALDWEEYDPVKDNIDMMNEYYPDHNIRLIAYEGGQHLAGYYGSENNAALMDLFQRANRDPRMKDLYLKYLNHWKANGGHEFALFNSIGEYTKWGCWGLKEKETDSDEESPKFDAVLDFIRDNPVWWEEGTSIINSKYSKVPQFSIRKNTLLISGVKKDNISYSILGINGRKILERETIVPESGILKLPSNISNGFYIINSKNVKLPWLKH